MSFTVTDGKAWRGEKRLGNNKKEGYNFVNSSTIVMEEEVQVYFVLRVKSIKRTKLRSCTAF